MLLFGQSLRVAWLQWLRFRNALLADNATNAPGNLIPDIVNIPHDKLTRETIHDCIFELNTLRFHRDLFAAAEREPLTTVYSAVWTLCSSLSPPRQLIEDRATKMTFQAHYTSNWYPLLLLQRYVKRLGDRALPVNDEKSDDDDVGVDDNDDETEMFTVEQLVAADKRYLDSFDEYAALRDHPEKARELFAHYENEYLSSGMLERMAEWTPYGTVERTDRDRVAYTADLRSVSDRRKLGNMFYRIKAYEETRSLAELRLRAIIKKDGVRLDQWLLPMERADEESVDEAETDPANRQYLMVWQYQKSHMVWFVVHTLFALNELVADDELTLDLLYFVTNCLERFVECGLCHGHWEEGEQKVCAMYEEQFAFAYKRWKSRNDRNRSLSQTQRLYTDSPSFTRIQALLDPINPSPAMFMIHVHNRVQSENVSPHKRLTRACLRAIRNDYAQYASAIANELTRDVRRPDVNTRTDVVEKSDQIFVDDMLRDLTTVFTSQTTVDTGTARDEINCDLSSERRAYTEIIVGKNN